MHFLLHMQCEVHALWTPLQVHTSPVVSWWQVFKLITEGEWFLLERIWSWKHTTKPAATFCGHMWILGKFLAKWRLDFTENLPREQKWLWSLSKVASLPSGHSRLTVIMNTHQMDASRLWACVSEHLCVLFKEKNNLVCRISPLNNV